MSDQLPSINPAKAPSAGERLKIYLEKAINTFYNPFEFDPNKYFSISALRSHEPLWGKHIETGRPSGSAGLQQVGGKPLTESDKLLNMFGSVAAKGAGFASLAAIAHLALRKAKNRKQKKDLRRYLNAAYPIVSLDPSVRDPKREEKEREFGIRNVRGLEEEQEQKTGQTETTEHRFNKLRSQISSDPASSSMHSPPPPEDLSKQKREWGPLATPMTWLNEAIDKAGLIRMPMHPLLQLAVPLAVAYGTYRGLDKVLDDRERKKLEQLNARKRNILQAMMHSEFERIRSTEKEAGVLEAWDEIKDKVYKFMAGAREMRDVSPVVAGPLKGLRHPVWFVKYGVPLGFTAWAIASAALAYQFAKTKFDKNDPRRQRMQTLQRFLRRRAISSGAPQFVSEEGFLTGRPSKMQKKTRRSKQKSVRVPEAKEKKKEEEPEVDKRDPYAALLK